VSDVFEAKDGSEQSEANHGI